MPPNSEGRVPSFSTRSTPATEKSWRSLSKPTGYGPHLFGLDRSYSTIKKQSATDTSVSVLDTKNAIWDLSEHRHLRREAERRVPQIVTRRQIDDEKRTF
jgi:hypothetical protein